jgi:hypothetical protein
VSRTWLKLTGHTDEEIESYINELFTTKRYMFSFNRNYVFSIEGDDITHSPIWIRPRSLLSDKIVGYTHICGHTTVKKIIHYDDVILIDCIPEFLLLTS